MIGFNDKIFTTLLISAGLITSLANCGGGGGGSTPPPQTVTYTLTVTNGMNGIVSVFNQSDSSTETCIANTICDFDYDENTALTLTAQPDANYQLLNWGGACTGTDSCALTITADANVFTSYEYLSASARACVEADPPPTIPDISWQTLATGLTNPVAIASANTITNRLFIGEQGGVIRTITNDLLDAFIFLDISDRVLNSGGSTLENLSGLTSIAFHPQFSSNGLFYVYYISARSTLNNIANGQCTNSDVCAIISEFDSNELSNGVPNIQAERQLMEIAMTTSTKVAGHIGFGQESANNLYISSGTNRINFLDGILLKINIDAQNSNPYTIPADNPLQLTAYNCPDNECLTPDYVTTPNQAIYAYGFRLPWQFSFDVLTGDLYLADVGEYIQEVNRIQSGYHYGATACEGNISVAGSTICRGDPSFYPGYAEIFQDLATYYYRGEYLGPPTYSYEATKIVGGFIYRGQKAEHADLCGTYVYADYQQGETYGIRFGSDPEATPKSLGPLNGVIALGTDQDLEIYAVSRTTGTLYKLTVP